MSTLNHYCQHCNSNFCEGTAQLVRAQEFARAEAYKEALVKIIEFGHVAYCPMHEGARKRPCDCHVSIAEEALKDKE